MARRFFDRQQFNFEFQFALGGCTTGLVILERCCRPPIASSMVMLIVGAKSGSLPDNAWRRWRKNAHNPLTW